MAVLQREQVFKMIIFFSKGPIYLFKYGFWRIKRWLSEILSIFYSITDDKFFIKSNTKILSSNKIGKTKSKYEKNKSTFDITEHFKNRETPSFFFDHIKIENLFNQISENKKNKTIQSANKICKNIFSFRNTPLVKFQNEIDWKYSPNGNIDWTWDLNRHAYFETLGRAYLYTKNEKYSKKFRELLLRWINKNPPHVKQLNWHSVFEVAFRINTWIWAFYLFRKSDIFDNDLCQAFIAGLYVHGTFLDLNLEHHAQNNHLLLEAKTLALLGCLFPEFKKAKRWFDRGIRILYQQIEKQFCKDGVHRERATHYHRVITGELLELFVLFENNKISIPKNILEIYKKMIEYELWITKPDGSIPLLGDSALKDTHLRFSAARGGPVFLNRLDLKSIIFPLDETCTWLLGVDRIRQYESALSNKFKLNSRAFAEGGYFVMRYGQNSKSLYLIFDCGPFGHIPSPNHGHADALSFELYAFGKTMLIDPGVFSSNLGADWRNFFRGSKAHNTVVVDDKDQSILINTNRVFRPAKATLHEWITNDNFDFVDGSHNGYERLYDPVNHRRQIFFLKPEYWIVIDVLSGQEKHLYDQYFHFVPNTKVHIDRNNGILQTHHYFESGLTIIPLKSDDLQVDILEGENTPVQGWVSYFSGEKLQAPVVRYRKNAVAQTQFNTVLYPYCAASESQELRISNLTIECDNKKNKMRNGLTGLKIETNMHIDLFVVDRNRNRNIKYFENFETDGQLVFIRQKKDSRKIEKYIITEGHQLKLEGLIIH